MPGDLLPPAATADTIESPPVYWFPDTCIQALGFHPNVEHF